MCSMYARDCLRVPVYVGEGIMCVCVLAMQFYCLFVLFFVLATFRLTTEFFFVSRNEINR